MDSNRVSLSVKWAGIVSVGLVGLLHLVEAPEYYGEVKYIGALFVLSAIGAALAVFGIAMNQSAGWILGATLAGANFLAYILSRTIGLPQFHENSLSQFLEPMGLLSLSVEAAAFVICVRALRSFAIQPDGGQIAMG